MGFDGLNRDELYSHRMQLPLPTPQVCSHRMQPESQKLLHNQYYNLKTSCPILVSFSYPLGTSSIPLQHSIRSVEHLTCSTAKAVESAAPMENPTGFTTGLGQVFDLPTLTTALLRNFFYQTFVG